MSPDEIAAKYGGVVAPPDADAIAAKYGGVSASAGAPQQNVPGMESLGPLPGAPKPPLPTGLSSSKTQQPDESRLDYLNRTVDTSRIDSEMEKDKAPFRQIGQGVSDIKNAPTGEGKAHGASEVIRGGLGVGAAALPALAPMAPVATAAGLAAGTLAGGATEYGLKKLGVPQGYAELGGDVAGIAAGGKAAKSGEGISETVREHLPFANVDPYSAMTKAIKPRSTNIGFADSLQRSMPELKATEQQLGKPIENINDLIAATKAAKQRIWSQYQQILGPRAQANIDGNAIADAMVNSIDKRTRVQNPQLAAQIEAKANTYRRAISLQEAEDFLHGTNADLDTYFQKYPTAQRSTAAKNPDVASTVAEGDALRNSIYSMLDQPGEGAAPRELKQRYGALLNLEDNAYRRKVVADRQQPDSLSQQLGKWSAAGHIVKGLVTKDPSEVAMGFAQSQAAKYLRDQQTTDALIGRAFRNYKVAPTPVQAPPPFQPKGLLTQGDIITPPPADASYVRSRQGMAQPPNPGKALPSPDIITPPPPDTSGIKTSTGEPLRAPVSKQLPSGPSVRPPTNLSGQSGDVTDLIPVKNPVTGSVEYIPRPNLSRPIQINPENIPQFRKGGIIRKPTVGLVGEAGKEKIVPVRKLQQTAEGRKTLNSLPDPDPVERTSAKPTVPETQGTIHEQFAQLQKGIRRVVMLPKGTANPEPPPRMSYHRDSDGNRYVFDPKRITRKAIRAAIAGNRLPSILGAAHGGMGAPDKSKMKPPVAAVVGKTKSGTTTQATASDKSHIRSAIRQTKKVTPKGGSVSIEPPEKEIRRRLA